MIRFHKPFLTKSLTFALVFSLFSCQPNEPIKKIADSKLTELGIAKINLAEDPETLDPRKARCLPTQTICRMLFEGLTRINQEGHPEPAVAESIDISEDRLTYIFHLRETFWSNGDRVTAFDFEYAWRQILNPEFPSPQAFMLYVIKNAKGIKEGTEAINLLGINAIDDYTLSVELKHPIPYFLELTSFRTYFPVNSLLDKKDSNWAMKMSDGFVCNGPFRLAEWKHGDQLVVEKNPNYWDEANVKLGRIEMVMVDPTTEFNLYQQQQVDWAGSPLSTIPLDAIESLRKQGDLKVIPAAATNWYRFNTVKAPLNNIKFRKALTLAINREEIVTHITQAGEMPAVGIIPPSKEWICPQYFSCCDEVLAKILLNEALDEMNLTIDQLPAIEITYKAAESTKKINEAIQQQWAKALGLNVTLQAIEGKVFWDTLKHGEFMIANGNWFADVNDPMNFLEVFRERNNGTNNTGWENPIYQGLLRMAELEPDAQKRLEALKLAEEVLMKELPIAPIYFYTLKYVKNPKLHGVYLSDMGWLDFKHAEIEKIREGEKR